MNKFFALVVCLSIGAMATPINLGGPETNLQQILNDITVAPISGVSHVNVLTDQLVFDEEWTSTASGGAIATFVVEFAGNAITNSFGIYDLASAASVEVFSGVQTAGAQSTITFFDNGLVTVSDLSGLQDFALFTSDDFGFYLETASNGIFYSQVSKNADGADHMVAFQGNDLDVLKIDPYNAGVWTSDEYILAWEDLPFTDPAVDGDFNDLVVLVESVRPVPEPATLSLIGIGVVTMLSSCMIRRKKV